VGIKGICNKKFIPRIITLIARRYCKAANRAGPLKKKSKDRMVFAL
jgi:hypothetical protein